MELVDGVQTLRQLALLEVERAVEVADDPFGVTQAVVRALDVAFAHRHNRLAQEAAGAVVEQTTSCPGVAAITVPRR